jgi:hypothetical protein
VTSSSGLRKFQADGFLFDRVYQALIRKKKNSWKQYCNTTSPGNPRNEAYKLSSGKTRNTVKLTMLQKTDGSKTANMKETLKMR